MCGRFEFGISSSKKSQQLKEQIRKLNLSFDQGEIFPTNKVLCVIGKETKIDLASMKWGIKKNSLLINARVETLDDKPTYKAIKNKRCAIICNGFYEWDKEKTKYYISFEEEFMYLACIFNEDNELVILTKEADDEFQKIHSRMPIILNQDEMISYVHLKDYSVKRKTLIIKSVHDDIKLF